MISRPALLAIAIALLLLVSAGYYIAHLGGGQGVTIDMEVTSGTPQNGAADKFLPATFNVTEGERVTVVFDNTDDGPHELQIPEFQVSTGIVQGGQTARVVFVPEKIGTFAYDQPIGVCDYGGLSYAQGGCTGQQETNGTVTVLPPP
jgi:plastocyanin